MDIHGFVAPSSPGSKAAPSLALPEYNVLKIELGAMVHYVSIEGRSFTRVSQTDCAENNKSNKSDMWRESV